MATRDSERWQKQIQERLEALTKQDRYQDEEALKKAICVLAGRCALRMMPFCGRGGAFPFGESDVEAVETAALLAVGYGKILLGPKVYVAAAAAVTSASAAANRYADQTTASPTATISLAADAVAISYNLATAVADIVTSVTAITAVVAVASAIDSALSYAGDFRDKTEADLKILERGEAEFLSELPLWVDGPPDLFIAALSSFAKALYSMRRPDISERYEGFLLGKANWEEVRRVLVHRFRTQRSESVPRPKAAAKTTSSKKAVASDHVPLPERENPHVDPHGMSDAADPDDKLGYDRYADGLATFLLSERTRPPLRISIEGAWGCGKSSFLLNLRNKLEKLRPGTKRMWFNPWRHDAGEALWAAFAVEFERQIMSPGDKFRRAWKRLARWEHAPVILAVGLGSVAALWLWWGLELGEAAKWPVLAGLLAGGTYAFDHLLTMWKHPLRAEITRILKTRDYGEKVSAIERFHEDFADMVANVSGGERIFVFIDDLDRCSVPRSAELLESLTLLVSPSGTEACGVKDAEQSKPAPIVFVLGLDREKVAAGVAVKYEKLLPYVREDFDEKDPAQRRRAGLSFGYNFIEKFIELSYQLPRPRPENIRIFLERSLGWEPDRLPASGPLHVKDRAGSGGAPSTDVSDPDSGESWTDVPTTIPGVTAKVGKVQHSKQSASQAQIKAEAVERLEESGLVGEVVAMAAPLLGNNPRRIKQFINVFRLRAHLAAQTGILGRSEEKLTLQQLGKFVALELIEPGFLPDVIERGSSNPRFTFGDILDGLRSPLEDKARDTFMGRYGAWLERADIAEFISQHPPRAKNSGEWNLRLANPLSAAALAEPVGTSDVAAGSGALPS